MDANGADASRNYFSVMRNNIDALASATAHQTSAQQQQQQEQQQGEVAPAATVNSYGTELWQQLLHGATQQQQHHHQHHHQHYQEQQAQQLYNQFAQPATGYQTEWSSYGNAFTSPELQSYIDPQFQNQPMFQQIQQTHQHQAQPTIMAQADIQVVQGPAMQQQHGQIVNMQIPHAQLHSQQMQYVTHHPSAANMLQALYKEEHAQQQESEPQSEGSHYQLLLSQAAHQQLQKHSQLSRKSVLAAPVHSPESHQQTCGFENSIAIPASTAPANLRTQGTQCTSLLQAESTEISVPSSPVSNVEEPVSITADKFASDGPARAPDSYTLPSAKMSRTNFRPRASIPQNLTPEEYAKQCNQAAINSRLSPYLLHRSEYQMLRKSINHHHVTTYLNIRNGILRLWQRNPLVSVTREEAAGCAKDYRFFEVAEVAYEWLVRNGYINFGCVEVPNLLSSVQMKSQKRKTIVVIGAGMSGLSCARQLEGLFQQLGDQLEPDEGPPEIIVLEARGRIGGRVYSHPLNNQSASCIGPTKRATADLGAQIITGFDNGNPLNVLVRGQLALDYHSLKDNSRIYDSDGKLVDKEKDNSAERLFNDILDRVAVFKLKSPVRRPIEGDKDLVDAGKDPAGDGGRIIAKIEENEVELPSMPPSPPRPNNSPFSAAVDRLTGKPTQATGSSSRVSVIEQLRKLGWDVKDTPGADSRILPTACGTDPRYPTLGKTMDDLLLHYQTLLELTPLDLRLINWHYANLEYANAANVEQLSLGSWDQDDGNEFRGPHAMLIGGYTQVPRGLLLSPRKLDVRVKHVVKKVSYKTGVYDGKAVRVECDNGTAIDADKVVVTVPLGVLKSNAVEFDPPLPTWKQGAIERLGYGLLNKVIMVFDEPFWDTENDMTGFLQLPTGDPLKQTSYEARRGRFYLFWNCTKASGRPMLVALMAGEAAYQAEREDDESIIKEAVAQLAKIYSQKQIPFPSETIITRWQKDKFSRGSYSYVGRAASGEDYNVMAKPVKNTIFFAGEATCGTHPATVHGAYISGLRVANDVAESLLGPIKVSAQLIPPRPKYASPFASLGPKRKVEKSAAERSIELKEARVERYEEQLKEALYNALGERPVKPGRTGANPFLLYQKDHWFICRAKCDEARQQATGNPEAKATRNEVRAALGLMWREAPKEQKRPYLEATETNKKSNTAAVVDSKRKMQQWDEEAEKFRTQWMEKNPSIPTAEEIMLTKQAELEARQTKKNKTLNGYPSESE